MNKVSIKNLIADPIQPRQEFDREKLTLLENSIKEKGVLNPLIVEDFQDGKYLIIDGERRYRAAKNVGLKEIPVEIVKPMTVSERVMMRFHLQEQHENWSIFDRARAMATFQKAENIGNREVAELLGMSVGAVSMWTDILKLSKRSQAFVNERRIPYSYTHQINRLTNIYEKFTDTPRADIEMNLLQKYDNRIMKNMNDYKALIRIGNEGDKKVLMAFLNNPKMSVKAVLDKTIYGEEIKLDVIAYRAKYLTMAIRKTNLDKLSNLTPFQQTVFHNLIESCKKILTNK